MKQKQKVAYLKALIYIAAADDTVQDSERAQFTELGKLYGLTNQEVTVAMVYGLGWGAVGASIGAAALSWIPVVGPVVGGLVGGIVGYMAGSKFGETVYKGIKAVHKGIVTTCKAAWNTVNSIGRRIKAKLAFA